MGQIYQLQSAQKCVCNMTACRYSHQQRVLHIFAQAYAEIKILDEFFIFFFAFPFCPFLIFDLRPYFPQPPKQTFLGLSRVREERVTNLRTSAQKAIFPQRAMMMMMIFDLRLGFLSVQNILRKHHRDGQFLPWRQRPVAGNFALIFFSQISEDFRRAYFRLIWSKGDDVSRGTKAMG